MKILFINKYDITGGAAIAAYRLYRALSREYSDIDIRFLVGIKRSKLQVVESTRKPGLQNLVERGINLATSLVGMQYLYFPFSTKTILKKARELQPDVIHLHNLHGGYFETALIPLLSEIAPLVWTLHDMWAFTGSAAHTYGDESWKQLKAAQKENRSFPMLGLNTGSWLLKRKQELYQNTRLTVVGPSDWLAGLARQSPVFQRHKVHHIFHGIDLTLFIPGDKRALKKAFGINPDEKVLVFAAESISRNKAKGGMELLQILSEVNKRVQQKIHLLVIGGGDVSEFNAFSNLVVHPAGYVFAEEEMAKYLRMADLLLLPTKAETISLALIEASASGTPSISYDIGGCSEVLSDGETGYTIAPFEIKPFADRILELLKNEGLYAAFAASARRRAEQLFDEKDMARKYYELYESLLSEYIVNR